MHVRVWGTVRRGSHRLLRSAGLRDVRVQIGSRHTGDPFVVLIASGVKRLSDSNKA